MADHRAEQIMDAFTTALTGLTTTGANVKRDRIYAWDTMPALSIFQGDDIPVPYEDRNYYLDDFELTIHVEMHVDETNNIPVSQTLNLIRKEVTIAIQANPTLGIPTIVIDTEEGTTYRPLIEHIDQVTATQTMDFTVKYRRSRGDPST